MENILEIKYNVQKSLERFKELYITDVNSRYTLYAAINLITVVSKKMWMYNPTPIAGGYPPYDEALYEEMCYLAKNDYQKLLVCTNETLMKGSISILRYVAGQMFLRNENGICDKLSSNILTSTILDIREAYSYKNIHFFEKYFMPLNADYLEYILNNGKKTSFKNWGALYRHLLPFVYDNDLKYAVWKAIEVLRDNLLMDLGLGKTWECLNSQGWHNHVRSYYGFEGPSNYGSQRAVIMLHPKNIPDHKNCAQLVCYFRGDVVDYGMDIGFNAKKFPETESYSNWQYISSDNRIAYEYGYEEALYKNIVYYFRSTKIEGIPIIQKAVDLNNEIAEKYTFAKVEYVAEGDGNYEEQSESNLYNDTTGIKDNKLSESMSESNGSGGKPPIDNSVSSGAYFNEGHYSHDNSGVDVIGDDIFVSNIYPNIKYYEDALSRNKIAETIVDDYLTDPKIEPLNIGIIGDWGSGKTQVINLLKNRLSGIKEGKIQAQNINNFVCIDYDALQYDNSERIWASLALEIMNTCRNKDFWFDLKFLVKRLGRYLRDNKIILPLKIFFVAVIYQFIMFMDGLFLPFDWHLYLLSINWYQILSLIIIIALLPELFKPVISNIEISFAKLFKSDNCSEKLGFEHGTKFYIKEALKALSGPKHRRIILFIENLDRCSSSSIREILDTICKFLEIVNEKSMDDIKYHEVVLENEDTVLPENSNVELFTVFAIDKNIVLEALKKENIPADKTYNYLEKIINMFVELPHYDKIETYIDRMYGKQRNSDIEHIIEKYKQSKFPPRRLSNFRYFEHLKTQTSNEEIKLEDIDRIICPEEWMAKNNINPKEDE